MHTLIILVAKGFIIIPVALLAYGFSRLQTGQRRRFMLQLIASGVLSFGLARIASHYITDPRPFVTGHFTPLIAHGADNGFPSDHTLVAAWISWLLFYYSRRLGLASLGVTILIGLARMAAGVHHSWDILGSIAITAIATLVVVWLYPKLARKR
jgi:undecaprenyl-diphosphatase